MSTMEKPAEKLGEEADKKPSRLSREEIEGVYDGNDVTGIVDIVNATEEVSETGEVGQRARVAEILKDEIFIDGLKEAEPDFASLSSSALEERYAAYKKRQDEAARSESMERKPDWLDDVDVALHYPRESFIAPDELRSFILTEYGDDYEKRLSDPLNFKDALRKFYAGHRGYETQDRNMFRNQAPGAVGGFAEDSGFMGSDDKKEEVPPTAGVERRFVGDDVVTSEADPQEGEIVAPSEELVLDPEDMEFSSVQSAEEALEAVFGALLGSETDGEGSEKTREQAMAEARERLDDYAANRSEEEPAEDGLMERMGEGLGKLEAGEERIKELEVEAEKLLGEAEVEPKDKEAAKERQKRPEGGFWGKASGVKTAMLNRLTGLAGGALALGGKLKDKAKIQERLDGARGFLDKMGSKAREIRGSLKQKLDRSAEVSEEAGEIAEESVPVKEMERGAVAEVAVDVDEAKELRDLAKKKVQGLMVEFKQKLESNRLADVVEAQKMFTESIEDRLGKDSTPIDLKFGGSQELTANELQGEIDFMLAAILNTDMTGRLDKIMSGFYGTEQLYGEVSDNLGGLIFDKNGAAKAYGSKSAEESKRFFVNILRQEVGDLRAKKNEELGRKADAIERFINERL